MMNGTPRLLNALLGGWLFISAFVWPHGPAQFNNTWLLGLTILVLSLLAGAFPWMRFLTGIAGVWLFLSTLLLPRSNTGTVWHNCILAVVVCALALTPSRYGRPIEHGPRT